MKKRADGRYCKQIRINGKTKSFYGHTQAEVNRKIMEYQGEKEHGRKFAQVADAWLAEYLKSVTYAAYRRGARASYNAAISRFGEKNIRDITSYDISLFFQSLAAKGYSYKTVSTYKSTLNMIFNYALISGDCEVSPLTAVQVPKNLPRTPRKFPSTEELRIVDTMHSGFGFFAYFLMYTGLRKSEALALDYKDIDFKNKRITVNKKIVFDGNTPILVNRTKTESGMREVILLDRLAEHMPKNKIGHIFCNEDGDYYTQKQYQSAWAKLQRDYGISVTAHQLRHAYATMLFEAGIDVKDAQELMGHSDINLTRSIYTHIRSERKDETAAKLNAFNF